MRRILAIASVCCCSALVVPLTASKPASSLSGVSLPRVGDGASVDLGAALSSGSSGKTLLVLGTFAGDFNMIEYAQRVRHYMPELKDKGVDRVMMVVNGEAVACKRLAEILDLPEAVELFADPAGEAGRRFGVSRGWMPDADLPPNLKLFVVGIGLGPPWGTLPAVLSGYVGNPSGDRAWIETALLQGQRAGRWPGVLELGADGSMQRNKFDDFPVLGGSWGRRPLELATLRLQNLASVQFKNWEELKPADDRCLTQLGGCAVVGPDGEALYSWVDEGLCDVPDFNRILDAL